MMGSNRKKSTSEKILDLINPVPVSYDPEDDLYEETAAKVVDKFDEDVVGSEGESNNKSLLKKNVFLDSEDVRYTGKRVSRKSLSSHASELKERLTEDKVLDDEEDSDEGDSFEQASENEGMSESYGGDGSSGEGSDSEAEGDGSESENDGSIMGSEVGAESDNDFKHITEQNLDAEVEKGNCVRNQLSLWDNLLECRIQLQKCLVTANKMPNYEVFDKFLQNGDADFRTDLGKCGKNTKNLLDKLITLRETLLASYPETKCLVQAKSGDVKPTKSEMDEEIPSDTEMEDNVEEEPVKLEVPKAKKRKLEDYDKLLDSQHREFMEFRNATIQKWNDKTRIAAGNIGSRNFSTFELSTLKQIEQILSNRQRLIQRTRLKRSEYEILGQDLLTSGHERESNSTVLDPDLNKVSTKSEEPLKEFHSEIFDDTDFYHQLLRELIERKSSDLTDPVQLGRQWIEIQKLRSKMKRKIDVKATKGRRIRYVVHPKLVNFMAPVSDCSWTEEAKTELFSSLFGKRPEK